MRAGRGRWRERLLLPLSLGTADGILSALTLASARVLHGDGLDGWLSLRVGTVALVSAVFTVSIAEYAQLRAELARSERQLNLTTSGRLASGRLGRLIARDAAEAALAAAVTSFLGAVLPLLVGAAVPGYSWSALAASVLALGALGSALASVVDGHRWRWVAALTAVGLVVTVIGIELRIA